MEKKIFLCILVMDMLLLSGCGRFLDAPIGGERTDGDGEAAVAASRYEITASDQGTEGGGAVRIDLGDPEGSQDEGFTYADGCLTIHAPGDYALSGSLDGGHVVIQVYPDEKVHLILEDARIHSEGTSAIYVETAGKVILTLAEGTQNVLSDSQAYDTDRKACVFSNCDLTINGNGILDVYGYHKDAIRTKDLLKVIASNVNVRSKGDGLRGNDGVILLDSSVSVESEGCGIYSDSGKDLVMIQGGSCSIIAGENAIAARQHVSIHGCDINLQAVWEQVECSGIRDIDG